MFPNAAINTPGKGSPEALGGHMSDTHDRKLAIPDYRNMLDAVPD